MIFSKLHETLGFPGGTAVRNPPANAGDTRDVGSIPGVGTIPWRRKWQPSLTLLLGKVPWTEDPGGLQFMGSQRVGYDLGIEHTHTHTHTQNSLCPVSVFIKHLKNLSIISC